MRDLFAKRIGVACLILAALFCAAFRPAQTQQSSRNMILVVPDTGDYAGTQFYTNSHAILIGINRYEHLPQSKWLHYAESDAIELRKLLIQNYGFLPENVTLLLNEQATKANIEKALSALDNDDEVKQGDRVLVYFSGHGQTVKLPEGGDMGFLIPYDADVDLDKPGNRGAYQQTCLPMDSLWRYFRLSSARHRLLIADACYGGLLADGKGLGEKPSPAVIKRLLTRPAMQVMTAGGRGEEAWELPEWGHGAFTYKLLEELRAQAAVPGSVFLSSQLAEHLEVSVGNMTHGKQSPQFYRYSGTEGDFIFVSLAPYGRKFETRKNDKDGAEMVYIPAGEFTMGSTQEEINALLQAHSDYKQGWFATEVPQHKVMLGGYYIYKNDVTVVQYERFCQATGHSMPPAPNFNPNWSKKDHPIVNVSWEDAKAYCDWAGASLPTEAQWEKAARGPEDFKFPWGNTFDSSKLQCSKSQVRDAGGTAAVGSYPANGYRLNDMAGNVWQWCADWYDANYYKNGLSQDPPGPATGQYRALRGGSWDFPIENFFRCACRGHDVPDRRNYGVGFRCVARAD